MSMGLDFTENSFLTRMNLADNLVPADRVNLELLSTPVPALVVPKIEGSRRLRSARIAGTMTITIHVRRH